MNCYILIGGRSTRMGRSKSELFLDRIIAAARPVFDEVIAVQRPGGETPSALRTIFEEPHQEQAPVFGVVRALQEADGPCFVLAVDYPLITREVLTFLRDRRGVPIWSGQEQPLCAVWDSVVLPRIEERIDSGRFDLRGLREGEMIEEAVLRARFPGEPLKNINTREELEALRIDV